MSLHEKNAKPMVFTISESFGEPGKLSEHLPKLCASRAAGATLARVALEGREGGVARGREGQDLQHQPARQPEALQDLQTRGGGRTSAACRSVGALCPAKRSLTVRM